MKSLSPAAPRPAPRRRGPAVKRPTSEINLSSIGRDTPLRLKTAADLFYPDGSMTVSGLRGEIRRGRLDSELVANKVYVTQAGIERMREKCREDRRARDSISENAEDVNQYGSSLTDRTRLALAAAQTIGAELRKPSLPLSGKSTGPIGETVIPLR